MSNFLGDSSGGMHTLTSVLSTTALEQREGITPQRGMNFRDSEPLLSVFLVLPSHDGMYRDAWDAESRMYTYEGHDSIAAEGGGKAADQMMMYGSGRLTENGRFYKAAHAYIDGIRREPLRIQVYEKVAAGAWFDKGIFELIEAQRANDVARMVFRFGLRPVGLGDDTYAVERMLGAAVKAAAWERDKGRCAYCESQDGLRFVLAYGETRLVCAVHRGEAVSRGLLG